MKKILYLLILFTFFLTACQPAVVEEVVDDTTAAFSSLSDSADDESADTTDTGSGISEESSPDDQSDEFAAADTDTEDLRLAFSAGGVMPGCTAVSQPISLGEEATLFPASIETDQVYGPETASVTIVEYGDFQ